MRPALLVSLLLMIPCAALAQPDPNGGEARDWDDLRPIRGGVLRVRTHWDAVRGPAARTGTVRVERLAADGRTVTATIQLYRGPAVVPALATSDDRAVVTLLHEGPSPFVKVALVEVLPDGRLSARPTVDVPREGATHTFPSWAVVAADPTGFAILWQETSMTDPNDAAHSFLGRLARDGTWSVRPHSVEVPWPTAAMAWNGHGWHLALWFGGFGGQGGPDGTRVCLVTLSEAGQPEQHPWWVSRPERVGEVQLLRTDAGMEVFWRGGRDGQTLNSVQSTQIGNWGTEPPPAQAHGAIGDAEPFTIREGAAGRIEVVRMPGA